VALALAALTFGLGVARTVPAIRTVERYYPEFYRRAGLVAEWIGDRAEIRRLALVDIGLIGYRSRKEVIDLGGLTDKVIARAPGTHLLKEYDPDYVIGRAPELVVFRTLGAGTRRTAQGIELAPDAISGVDRRLYEHPAFLRQYSYLCSAALGVEPVVGESREQILYAYHLYQRRGTHLPSCAGSSLGVGHRVPSLQPLDLGTARPVRPLRATIETGPGLPSHRAVAAPMDDRCASSSTAPGTT
jgi:hypothetical protein